MDKKILLIFVCLLMILPFANAIPPVQTASSPEFLQIAYPQYQYVPQNGNFTLYIHVYNTSTYITGDKASCYLDLYSLTGIEECHSLMNAGSSDYYVAVTKGNFSSLGEHSFIIQCNSSIQTGFANGVFEVTPTGTEVKNEEISLMVTGLVVLALFAILFMILGILINNMSVRIFFMVLSGLTLLVLIGLIAANSDYYLSDFEGFGEILGAYYIAFITLAGAGMIALIVWLIYVSVTAFNKVRGRIIEDD